MKTDERSLILAMAEANQLRKVEPDGELVTIPFESIKQAFSILMATSMQYGEDSRNAKNSTRMLRLSEAHQDSIAAALDLVSGVAWSRPDLIKELSNENNK